MRRLRKARWWVAAVALAATVGCSRQDTEGLSRVGRKVADRCEGLTAGVQETAQRGCQGIWTTWDSAALETRVSARLRWERTLGDAEINVRATGKTVELRGRVKGDAQRQRAVEVARETLGVERVEDLLEKE